MRGGQETKPKTSMEFWKDGYGEVFDLLSVVVGRN